MGRVLDVDYARQRKATPKVGQSQTSSYVVSLAHDMSGWIST